ncbi:MAG: hypothetical protein JST89_09380 [Cyanobacteria bacterium SZAS-4]|nr:hypothetical protein [Cyanobacteria bacterium SZAS-4]
MKRLISFLLVSHLTLSASESKPVGSQSPIKPKGESLEACRAQVLKNSINAGSKDVLHGIYRIKVSVRTCITPPKISVDAPELKSAIESKCRESGLSIDSKSGPLTPVLLIELKPMGSGKNDKQLVYIIRLQLLETTILAKDMKTRDLAPSFEYECLEAIGNLHKPDAELQKDILASVDRVIEEWRRANPR